MIVLGIGTAAWTVLLWRYGGAGPGVELDAIRTASAITAAAGGAVALLLAARRQQSTEQTLEHQREVAQATERDALEQRITELYARAVDQLGAEKAPVRLGGLHALERLAQDNPAHRQTIVDVICAYLRMPFTPPDDQAAGEDAPEGAHRRQELQVRLTAQRILGAHLNPKAAGTFWSGIDLNLTEAHLHHFYLTGCQVRSAQFGGATFTGDTEFGAAEFVGDAGFEGAEFTEPANFVEARFARNAWFRGAKFYGNYAGFRDATFVGYAAFEKAEFTADGEYGGAEFTWAKFVGNAIFRGAKFAGSAGFFEATFAGDASFDEAKFTGNAGFTRATFTGRLGFGRARFAKDTEFDFDGVRVVASHDVPLLPRGWLTRAAQPANGEEEGWLYLVRDEDSSA